MEAPGCLGGRPPWAAPGTASPGGRPTGLGGSGLSHTAPTSLLAARTEDHRRQLEVIPCQEEPPGVGEEGEQGGVLGEPGLVYTHLGGGTQDLGPGSSVEKCVG